MTTTHKASISLCMIVRNEAHQLADCLAPVADLFDDIVIVDTGSDDNTREVASRFTSRVFEFCWCDDFSAARNEALSHAQGEWIMWLDADDRVSPENVAKLKMIFATLADRPQAYLMQTRLHLDPNGRDPLRIATHIRLFRRHPDLKWRNRVHERLQHWPSALGHEIVATDVQIEHLGYRDAKLSQRKLRRNLRLLRMEFAVRPDDTDLLADLGYAYAQLGKPNETRRYLRAVLNDPASSAYLRRRAFTTLGEFECASGNFPIAVALLQQGLLENPGDEFMLYMYSEALYNLGQYAAAKAALLTIFNQPAPHQPMQIGVPNDIRQRLARLALGEVLRVELQLREAESVLLAVARDYPLDSMVWFFLGRVYTDWSDWTNFNEVVVRLENCPGGKVLAKLLQASAHFSRGELQQTERTLDELIPLAPFMVLPRQLRAECLNRRGAPPAEQMQACRDLLRIQPDNTRAREIMSRLQTIAAAAPGTNLGGLYTSVVLGAGVPSGVAVS